MSTKLRVPTIVEITAGQLRDEPEFLAAAFAEMGSLDQAKFFNRLAELSQTWPYQDGWRKQMLSVTVDSARVLTEGGKEIMRVIGEATKGLPE